MLLLILLQKFTCRMQILVWKNILAKKPQKKVNTVIMLKVYLNNSNNI